MFVLGVIKLNVMYVYKFDCLFVHLLVMDTETVKKIFYLGSGGVSKIRRRSCEQ